MGRPWARLFAPSSSFCLLVRSEQSDSTTQFFHVLEVTAAAATRSSSILIAVLSFQAVLSAA